MSKTDQEYAEIVAEGMRDQLRGMFFDGGISALKIAEEVLVALARESAGVGVIAQSQRATFGMARNAVAELRHEMETTHPDRSQQQKEKSHE